MCVDSSIVILSSAQKSHFESQHTCHAAHHACSMPCSTPCQRCLCAALLIYQCWHPTRCYLIHLLVAQPRTLLLNLVHCCSTSYTVAQPRTLLLNLVHCCSTSYTATTPISHSLSDARLQGGVHQRRRPVPDQGGHAGAEGRLGGDRLCAGAAASEARGAGGGVEGGMTMTTTKTGAGARGACASP